MEFYFITRCYNEHVERMMSAIKEKKMAAPDVIIMNSCLWDISRYMSRLKVISYCFVQNFHLRYILPNTLHSLDLFLRFEFLTEVITKVTVVWGFDGIWTDRSVLTF